MQLADTVATWSKDESTKVGAVIVGKKKRLLDLAYNGFPRGVSESPERNTRPAKYLYTEHAERNAINNCARDGISTQGATMYCTLIPCHECARSIIQAGIKRVVVKSSSHERYDFTATKEMFKEVNIKLIEL